MGLYVSLNGSVVNKNEAMASVECDGLFYGAGCFETLMSYRGKFLHLDRHIRRLNDGIRYLTGSEEDVFSEIQLRREISSLLNENHLTDHNVKVRIQVSLGGRNGYSVPESQNSKLTKLITTDKLEHRTAQSIQLVSSKTTVVPASCRPAHLKLSNTLHYRQAALEARQKGGDDALMCTVDGAVAETSIANIFWESKGTVYSPSAGCDILPGITSKVVIKLLNTLDVECKRGAFPTEEVAQASQVWVCNSIKELAWVTSIDDKQYSVESDLRNKLVHQFELYKKKNLK